MIRAVLSAVLLAVPLPAFALSFLAPSVERSYARFDASEDLYVVVHGRLTLEEDGLPKGMIADREPPAMTRLPALLIGHSLTQKGFVLPFEQDVTLEVSCIGPWCGSARNGEDVLAFLRKDADGYALAVDPCGGALFGTPKPEMMKQAETCQRTGNCTSD